MDIPILFSQFGFTRSGNYYANGGLASQSSGGQYWSRTPNGKSDAYYLTFNPTLLYPRYNISHGYGFSLRCLAR